MPELGKEDKVRWLAKALKEDVNASEGLKEHLIKRVSRIAASEIKEKAPAYVYLTSKPAIATAMASAAILVIFCLPFFLQIKVQEKATFGPSTDLKTVEKISAQEFEVPELLKVNAEKSDSSIILSWEGAEKKDVYRITRSNSPKDFTNAYTVMVAGNRWVDPLKNGSNIVYYKIE